MDETADSNSVGVLTGDRPRRYRSLVAISWLAVVGVVFVIVSLVAFHQFFADGAGESAVADMMGVGIAGKFVVGVPSDRHQIENQLAQFESGSLLQRYGHVILVNEINGPKAALKQLESVEKAVDKEQQRRKDISDNRPFPSERERKVRSVLQQLLVQYRGGDFDSSHLPDEDRQFLIDSLGWVANLALYPSESPHQAQREAIEDEGRQTFLLTLTGIAMAVLCLLGSVAAWFILFGFGLLGEIQPSFTRSDRGFVYLETFAIWLVLLLTVQLVIGSVVDQIRGEHSRSLLMSGVMFGSLVVLLWPIVRGVPVRSMMADIGWELRNPFAEGFVGALSYSCLIIPMIVGILLTVVISFGISIFVEAGEFDSAGPVGHPIVEELASGDWMMWGFVLLGACVAAPVVEETMFRGVLYRYLRDEAGSGKNRFWSVCVSSAANALIFALIHPQGVVAVPALMTLAIGFSLVREWRGSLLAPILMHAANNFLVTSVLFLLIS